VVVGGTIAASAWLNLAERGLAVIGPVRAPATCGSQTEPGLIIYRFGADLFYANVDRFADEARLGREGAHTGSVVYPGR
jgi:hypothetical protein